MVQINGTSDTKPLFDEFVGTIDVDESTTNVFYIIRFAEEQNFYFDNRIYYNYNSTYQELQLFVPKPFAS